MEKAIFLVFIVYSILVMLTLRGCVKMAEGMSPVQETIASYLSVGETSSLKAPSLPSKPLNLA